MRRGFTILALGIMLATAIISAIPRGPDAPPELLTIDGSDNLVGSVSEAQTDRGASISSGEAAPLRLEALQTEASVTRSEFDEAMARVRGTVRERSGRSVTGLLVTIHSDTGEQPHELLAADGRFELDAWPRCSTSIHVGVAVREPNDPIQTSLWLLSRPIRTPAPGEVLDVGALEVDCAATIRGRIVNPTQRPKLDRITLQNTFTKLAPGPDFSLDGAMFHRPSNGAYWHRFPASITRAIDVDDDGRFELRGLPASHYALGFDGRRKNCIAVALASAQELDLGDIALDPEVLVTGCVVDHEGTPVANAEIWAYSAGTGFGATRTRLFSMSDATGAFRAWTTWTKIGLLTRQHALANWTCTEVDARQPVVLQCERGTDLEVHVEGIDPDRVTDASVTVRVDSMEGERINGATWIFRGLAERSWSLVAESSQVRCEQRVSVKAPKTQVTLTLTPSSRIHVHVVDGETGAQLAGAIVRQIQRPRDGSPATIDSFARFSTMMRADAQGIVEFDLPANNDHTYLALYPGYRRSGDVRGLDWHSPETTRCTVSLAKPNLVDIRVHVPSTWSVSGNLMIRDHEQGAVARSSVELDEHGLGQLDVLRSGTARFVFLHDLDLIDANGNTSVAFDPNAAAIDLYVPEKDIVLVRGRVTIDGRLATGHSVESATTGAVCTVDTDGNYELDCVLRKRLGLRVNDSEGKIISTMWLPEAEGEQITHDITIHTASLAGRILGIDGRALQSICVTWKAASGNREAISDEHGHFDFGRSIAGRGRLRAWLQTPLGQRSQVQVEVDLRPGAHEHVELQMQGIDPKSPGH